MEPVDGSAIRGKKRRVSNNGLAKNEESDNSNDEMLALQWSNHLPAFGAAMSKLRSNETFCDVTLVSAQGEQFLAHKVVVSACSLHLQSMLTPLPRWQHPVLIMPKDLPSEDLRDILSFMYSGEVQVERGRLQSFLRSAETLQVHGLCDHQPQASVIEKPLDNDNVDTSKKNNAKKMRRNLATSSSGTGKVSTTIATTTNFTPLRPSSRNSPKAGPSNRPLESPIAVKIEEPNFSDEENHPEHVVIPSDPNSIGAFSNTAGTGGTRHDDSDPIAAENCGDDDNDSAGKTSSLCCPLCQALLSNRNALRYHMNYVHALSSSRH